MIKYLKTFVSYLVCSLVITAVCSMLTGILVGGFWMSIPFYYSASFSFLFYKCGLLAAFVCGSVIRLLFSAGIAIYGLHKFKAGLWADLLVSAVNILGAVWMFIYFSGR